MSARDWTSWDRARGPALRALGLGAAVALLSAVLAVDVPGPMPPPLTVLRPSPDLVVALALAALAGRRFPRTAALAVAVYVLVLRGLRTGDALMIAYFGRTVTVYLDVHLVPELVRLLGDTMSPARLALIALIGLAGVAALLGASFALARAVIRAWTASDAPYGLAAAALLALALAEVVARAASGGAPVLLARSETPRLVQEVDFALQVWGYRGESQAALAEAGERLDAAPSDLARFAGTDVVLLFAESYGTTVFEHPDQRARFAPALETFAAAVTRDGWQARSRTFVSPTFGGASWLAHGTVASGLALTSQLRFDLLVTSELVPLATRFGRRGFHTVAVMPGTKRPWPEGRFFGYDEHVYGWQFDYEGRGYDWAPMPDQFVLARVLRLLDAPRREPTFAEVVLVSSHAPWRRQPPYLEDWSRLGDGSLFGRDEVVLYDVPWPDLTSAGPAYVASLDYVLRCVSGFLERIPADRSTVVVLLGDHQPSQQVTGEGAPWTVPAHVLSRDPRLLEGFAPLGWTPGLRPDLAERRVGLERLPLDLLIAGSAPTP